MRALAWFRGWVTEKEVAEEFDDLCIYMKKSFAYSESHTVEELTDLTKKTSNGERTKIQYS